MDSLIGQQLDVYKIEELLGHGGMARVYRALDTNLQRYAAIKVVDPDVRKPEKYQKRFDREARAIASLSHPHIVIVYHYNQVKDFYYMAMEYVRGADLSWVLNDYARNGDYMEYDVILRLIEQTAAALDYAHKNGVIHRDIKPGNIMIDRTGNIKLTDFGLALMTSEGTGGEIFGSPHYIAPEQAMNSATVVPQTDLYSLGVVLYEMLTGDVPYSEGSAMQIAMGHLNEPLPDPRSRRMDLPDVFVKMLKKALAKEPGDRYQTGAEFVDALEEAIQQADMSSGKKQSGRRTADDVSPSEKVAKRLTRHLPREDKTKPDTMILPDEASRAHAPQNQSSGRRVALALLVLLLLTGGIVGGVLWSQQSSPADTILNNDSALPAVNAAIEGVVERKEVNQLVIYGLPVEIQGESLLLSQIRVGDRVRINGHTIETENGLLFDYVASATINDAVFVTPTPEPAPTAAGNTS
jgi:serine/threonine protein kinase